MPTFPVPCGPFYGMTQAQLQAALAQAQAAYIALMTGQKGVTFSYAQGDGAKSVTYQATSLANILAFIMMLEQALGIPGSRRRPLRPVYGP
jgi:hypothetical protein